MLSGQTPTEAQWRLNRSARVLGIPVVLWLQDFYSIAVERLARKRMPILGRLAGLYYRYLEKEVLNVSSEVVAISEDFVPALRRFGVSDNRITVIHNWCALEDVPFRAKCNSWSKLHELENKFVFLYSGTLAMKHNPDILCSLAVHFHAEPSVRVVVISEGPGAVFLQSKILSNGLSNMKVLPFQRHEDMPGVLATADVAVTLLEREAGEFSVPSKVLTYHAAGCTILGAVPRENLASRIMGAHDSGICVEPDNIKSFVDAALMLYSDGALRRRLAGNAKCYAEANFDIGKIADRFWGVFAKALDD